MAIVEGNARNCGQPCEIYLIGTSHLFQVPGQPGADAFAREVTSAIKLANFTAIGEEMSPEALAQRQATESICKQIADKQSIRHRYCDPDMAMRRCHGIEDEYAICYETKKFGYAREEGQRRIKRARDRREQYWLCRVLALRCWPILFICGAEHVDSFAEKAIRGGRSVQILFPDWAPTVHPAGISSA
jgi:hypothetical protein